MRAFGQFTLGIVAVVGAVSATSGATASIINYQATGIVSRVDAPLDGKFSLGQTFSLQFRVDDSVSDSNSDPTIGLFLNAVAYSFDIGGGSYQFANTGNFIQFNKSFDSVAFRDGSRAPPSVAGLGNVDILLDLIDSSGTSLNSSEEIAEPIPSLSNFDRRRFLLSSQSTGSVSHVSATLTSL